MNFTKLRNKRFILELIFVAIILILLKTESTQADCVSEPNVEIARAWWPLPRNVWTPLGWKSHLFRFQVVYDGTLLVTPAGWLEKPHTKKYAGQNADGIWPGEFAIKKSTDGKTLNISFKGDWRGKPKKIILQAPPIPELRKIVVNGKSHSVREFFELKQS